MHQTLKNVCIFFMFLMAVVLLDYLKNRLGRFIRFDYGETTMLLVWAVGYIILFHALYHYLGKQSHTIVYILTSTLGLVFWALVHFHAIRFS